MYTPHFHRRRAADLLPWFTAGCALLAVTPAGAADGPDAAASFAPHAALLYRTIACAGAADLPAQMPATPVARHCQQMTPRIAGYKARLDGQMAAFFAKLRPADLPTTVVYPFGGGDLISALTTYPGASTYYTVSLEHAGDPRRIGAINRAALELSLAQARRRTFGLLAYHNSTSANLMQGERGDFPGQLTYFLVALAVHGYEPVDLRFFELTPDGQIDYLTAAEITAREAKQAATLKPGWVPPDDSEAFSHAELTFRKTGAAEPVKTHRHLAWNLSNVGFGGSALEKHLQALGPVATMTKAASYLLWRQEFSAIAQYLLKNMVFMVSDSTGLPPGLVQKEGFWQETYGIFTGSFLRASGIYNAEFRRLWTTQPARDLPFRYGYLDAARHYHLMVTRRGPAPGWFVPVNLTVAAVGTKALPAPKPQAPAATKPAGQATP